MPQVDFTLEDVLKDVQKIVDGTVSSSEKRVISHLTAHMDMRFQETHIATAEVITAVNEHMDGRFGAIDSRLDGMEGRMDKMDQRLGVIDGQLDGIDERFDKVDERFDNMVGRFDEVQLSTAAIVSGVNNHIDQRFDELGSETRQLKRVVGQHSKEIMDLKAKVA